MAIPPEISTLVFDWGNTLMAVDPRFDGPMAAWPEVRAMPGAKQCLDALRPRFRLAVCTNAADSSASQVRTALARVGLDGFFSDILTFAELGTKKPDPLFFQRAAAALKSAPHELVMVGDTYSVDIPGAKQAGWRAAWLNPAQKAAPGPLPLHDVELTSLDSLPQALERLDLPDVLTCQAWYLEQGGVAALWQHVEAVGLASYWLAIFLRSAGQAVDPLLAHRGGLLHDIAKISAKHSPNHNHGEVGAEILRQKNQPVLAEISRRHLLFYLRNPHNAPRTWEEKIVHFADKICEGPRLVEWPERLQALSYRYPDQYDEMRSVTPLVFRLQAEIASAAGFSAGELVERVRAAINS